MSEVETVAAESVWRFPVLPAHWPLSEPVCVYVRESQPQAEPGWGQMSGLKAGSFCLSRGAELKARSLSCGRCTTCECSSSCRTNSVTASIMMHESLKHCDSQCFLLSFMLGFINLSIKPKQDSFFIFIFCDSWQGNYFRYNIFTFYSNILSAECRI